MLDSMHWVFSLIFRVPLIIDPWHSVITRYYLMNNKTYKDK